MNKERRIQDGVERQEYHRRIGEAVEQSDWALASYATMSTHSHSLMLAGLDSFDSVIRGAHSGFAGWLNRRQGRLGPVFAGRPMTIEVEAARAGSLIAYHHNNPVRAGVVDDASDSSWTSHRAYLGLDQAPSWLDVSLGLSLAGFSDDAVGRADFERLVRLSVEDPLEVWMTGEGLSFARKLANERADGAVDISYPRLEGRRLCFEVASGRAARAVALTDIIRSVAAATEIRAQAICNHSRSRKVVAARRLVVLTARRLGLSYARVGLALGISREATGRLARRAGPAMEEAAKVLATKLAQNSDDRWPEAPLVV